MLCQRQGRRGSPCFGWSPVAITVVAQVVGITSIGRFVVTRSVWCLLFQTKSHTCSVCSLLPLHHSSCCVELPSQALPHVLLAAHGFAPSHIIVPLWHKPVSIAPIPHYCLSLAQTSCTTPVAMHVSLWHKQIALPPCMFALPHHTISCLPCYIQVAAQHF